MQRALATAAIVALGAMLAPVGTAGAQEPERPPVLEPVRVTVTRDEGRSVLDVPFGLTIVRPDSARPGQRHTALDETLFLVPGLAVANRNNPTQDPRVSIRGFGARSAFGVRGVRVLRDGMPLTLPDGQTPLDYLDLESVGSVEVIRGSASALYGNAGGGVIDFRSNPPPSDALAVQARGWTGDDGFSRWTGTAGGSRGSLFYQGTVSRTETDGFRAHAAQRATHGYARVGGILGQTTVSLQALGFDMPLAENPGALTAEEFRATPELADPQNVRRNASKIARQSQFGLSATRPLGDGEMTASVYSGTRSLDNPLSFAIVDIGRTIFGGSVRATTPVRLFGTIHRLSMGVDAQSQDDDRRNFANCNDTVPVIAPTESCPTPGRERGVLTLDQNERIWSVGPYVRDEIALGPVLRLSVGVRADHLRFTVDDHLISDDDPDDSGARTMRAVSPMAGLVARLGERHAAYFSVSSAFETPTTTELGNQPDGSAGINPELDPQHSTTYEVGVKGALASRLEYSVAAFSTAVRDELIPFEVPGSEGRRFFRNAGRTARRGAEAGLTALAGPLVLGASYSYAHFEFEDYTVDGTSFDGRRIPGIPQQQLQTAATLRLLRAYATVEGIFSGSVFVDDANSARAPGYEVMNLRLGYTALFGRPWLAPVVGVQNVFDRNYAPSIVVNAARGRFYEPAPGRTVYAGLTIGLGR